MARIDPPLTDPERSLLLVLATRNFADESGCTHGQARVRLGRLMVEGKLDISSNAEDVYVRSGGTLFVEVKRDWLAFHAEHPGNDPMKDERRERED
jgi:hypothetical protein